MGCPAARRRRRRRSPGVRQVVPPVIVVLDKWLPLCLVASLIVVLDMGPAARRRRRRRDPGGVVAILTFNYYKVLLPEGDVEEEPKVVRELEEGALHRQVVQVRLLLINTTTIDLMNITDMVTIVTITITSIIIIALSSRTWLWTNGVNTSGGRRRSDAF